MAKLDENNYIKGTENSENFYQIEPGPQGSIKPAPVADHTYFVFNDLKKGQISAEISSEKYRRQIPDYEIAASDPDSIHTITNSAPLDRNQMEALEIFFE